MKILLEAYLARNFGDDLFVMLLARHYHEHEFYLIDDENRGAAIIHSNYLHNLHSIAKQEVAQCIHEFGAYIFVGGDFYPPYIDYDGRCDRIGRIKENGGRVFVLGASLYKHYPEDSLPDVNRFFNMVDVVSFRDKASCEQCKHLFPRVCAYDTCDMAFTLSDQFPPKSFDITHIENLGISVRRKMNGTQTEYATYIGEMAETAEMHLKRSRENRVTFLAFSTCEYDDRDTADDIIALIDEPVRDRIRIVEYSRDVMAFIEQIGVCDAMICTRFHSLCMALILSKPFAVINYEAKIENLLSDLKYEGLMVSYGESITGEELLDSIKSNRVDAEALGIYRSKGNYFFCLSDLMLEMSVDIMKTESNNENANVEKEIIERQQKLLNEQKEKINQQLKALSVQNQRIEKQLAEIESQENRFQTMKSQYETILREIALYSRQHANYGREITGIRSAKMAHLLSRLHNQFLRGTRQEKIAFLSWLFKRTGKNDHSYNPLYPMIESLDTIYEKSSAGISGSIEAVSGISIQNSEELGEKLIPLAETLNEYSGRYVCVLPPIVDFDIELFQRPQQIGIALAELGIMLIYVTPNYNDHVLGVRKLYDDKLILIPDDVPLDAILQTVRMYKKESVLEVYSTDVRLTLAEIKRLQAYADRIVYEYIDEISPEITGKVPEFVIERHKGILADPSFNVLSTADKLHSEVVEARGGEVNCVLSSNGVDIQHFTAPRAEVRDLPKDFAGVVKRNKPIIGYYGAIATWFDFELLKEAAALRPDYEFVVIGPTINDKVNQKIVELKSVPNITVCNAVNYKKLPGIAQYFTVATIPFVCNDITESTSPIKIFEYMAMGKPVVTSYMRECLKYPVYVTSAVQDYVAKLDLAIADTQNPVKIDEIKACADQYSWTACAMQLMRAAYPAIEARMEWIVLSAIDWDFRIQRPQHLARLLAENGDRVTYVNTDMSTALCEEKRGNVDLIKLAVTKLGTHSIFLLESEQDSEELFQQLDDYLSKHHIRTANILVEYPTWFGIAKRLKEKYGFHVFFDYIDEYEGFNGTNDNKFIQQGVKWLNENSSAVFASSQYLYERTSQAKAPRVIVRNGTDSSSFVSAKGDTHNEKKTVGYYGAVADWFDTNLVLYAAKQLMDCRFVIVGNCDPKVAAKLGTQPNVELIGEVPYSQLTKWLKTFDVCLIPFKASLSLIKATNPVKFYEYLSAGKKVVTTEIEELMPFRDRYVLMSNDPDGFTNAIKHCLHGTDGLISEEERIAFGKANDWRERAAVIRMEAAKVYPKVSIVVLTWNNAKYNIECLRSIYDYSGYPNLEVIVVDNASTDGTPDRLKKFAASHNGIKLVLNNENLGFAAGMNSGIREATGDYYIILNNDTVVTPGWISGMMAPLQHKEIGAVGCMTNSIANEAKVEGEYDVIAQMNDFALMRSQRHAGEIFDIKVLALFCTMVSRTVVDEVGLLDEQFKVGMFEDDDYSLRLHKHGYRTVCAEDVFIHHYGRSSFKQLNDSEYMQIFNANKERYEKKHGISWSQHVNG